MTSIGQDDIAAVTRNYWNKFYAQAGLYDMSTFCRYVLESAYLRRNVLDLGCGNGRDTFGFAKHAAQVVGIDQSDVAIENCMDRVRKEKISGLSFRQCKLEDVDTLRSVVSDIRANDGQGLLFYCRFVLHAIREDVQDALLKVVGDAMREGDVFAAEFRTAKDRMKDHVHGSHYRRYQDAGEIKQNLNGRYGLRVAVFQEGNGFSPYMGEDPELCRLIAVRPS